MLFDFDEYLIFDKNFDNNTLDMNNNSDNNYNNNNNNNNNNKCNVSEIIKINEVKNNYNGIQFWCSFAAVLNMNCINKKFNNNNNNNNNNKNITLLDMNNRDDFKGYENIKKISKCLTKNTELFTINDNKL